MMLNILNCSLCLIFIMSAFGSTHGAVDKEVLIRDNTVMVLCDQLDDYLESGEFPAPVKILPNEYRNFIPLLTNEQEPWQEETLSKDVKNWTPVNGSTKSKITVLSPKDPGMEGEGGVQVFGVVTEGNNAVSSVIGGVVQTADLTTKLALQIDGYLSQHESREMFLRGLLYEIQFLTGGICNCLVFNLNNKHINGLIGVKYFQRHEFNGVWFGVWVMEGGAFRNKDKLYSDAQWGFAGDYSTSGSRQEIVVFNNRKCDAQP